MKLLNWKMGQALLAVIAVAVLGACTGGNQSPEDARKAAVKAAAEFSLLDMVPADSPYVMAASRRMPEKLAEKLLEGSASDIVRIRASLDNSMGQAADDRLVRLLRAMLSEFDGKMTPEGLKTLGLPINGRMLAYGLGVLPVAWLEIEDPAKVKAMIERIEANSGMKAEKLARGKIGYRRIPMDKLVAVLAVTDEWMIFALLPAKSEQELLPFALGEESPKTSLLDTGGFKDFVEQRKFLGYGDGYIDLVRLADMFLGNAEGINATVLEAMGVTPEKLSPACIGFVKSQVRSVPLLSAGFTELSDSGYTITGTVETSPAVGGWLKKMAAAVPGVGIRSDAAFTLGMGLNLPQMRDGLKALMRNFIENGKGCEMVDAQSITQAMRGMDMVLNPMVAGIKGFNLEVTDLQIDPQTLSPEAVDSRLLVSSVDPKGLFGLLGMLNPQFAQLDIPADGTPVKLPMEALLPTAPATYAAIKGELLVLSTGPGAPGDVSKTLESPVAEVPPLLAFGYNPKKLLESAAPTLQGMIASMPKQEATELDSLYNSLKAEAELYNYGDFRLLGTDSGLRFTASVEFNEGN